MLSQEAQYISLQTPNFVLYQDVMSSLLQMVTRGLWTTKKEGITRVSESYTIPEYP